MASSTAAAYRNPDSRTSEKEGKFFSRDRLETLFENCDLRPHHVNMITAMWRAAGKPVGSEILLFAAVEGYRIEARYRSRRAVQYNLRALETLGAIEIVKGANTIRRPTTYRLRTDSLGKRQTYADVKKRKRPQSISDSPAPSPARTPAPAQGHAAAPETPSVAAVPVPVDAGHRSTRPAPGSRAERRVHELRQELAGRMLALMKGSRDRAPMSQENALTSCCMYFGITADEAAQHLKLISFKPPDPPPPAAAPTNGDRARLRLIGENEPWQKILRVLEGKINRHSFETWLKPTRYAGEHDGVLYVRVPTKEFAHLRDKYADLLQEAIEGLGMEYRDVQFEASDD